MVIKSPYNFVPLSDKIYFPEWSNQISQDVPFSDGLSGVLDVTIELMSDAYIRNSSEDVTSFFKADLGPNGEEQFLIPGTSLKGMIRNVMKIASFGKMNQINDHRYSIRDLHYKGYTTGKMTNQEGNTYTPNVKAGWLRNGENGWEITPCDFARIEQNMLSPTFGTRRCSGVDKYHSYLSYLRTLTTSPTLAVDFTLDPNTPHNHSVTNRHGELEEMHLVYKKVTNLTGTPGTLVFTGQPSPRNGDRKRKHMEFVFYNTETTAKNVDNLKEDFEFIHSDERENPNPEWKYWKAEMGKGHDVPVFYLTNGAGAVESFGLAMMYRLPYKLTIGDAIIRNSNEDHYPKNKDQELKPDLSEVIFGYTSKKKSLKGRVQFSHFVETDESRANRGNQTLVNVTTILGSPKPTFYPNYIEQRYDKNSNRVESYNTMLKTDAKIRGWKRYPSECHNANAPEQGAVDNHGNMVDSATTFTPVNKGSLFKGKIRYFNLKPEELGALLWTLTWGKPQDFKYFQHKIGMAKPYGYGRILCHIINSDDEQNMCMQSYEEAMTENITDWRTSEQIKELLAMADVRNSYRGETTYPVLTVNPNRNEFADAKRRNRMDVLPRYSEYMNSHETCNIETYPERIAEERRQQEREQLEQENPALARIIDMPGSDFKAFIRDESKDLEEKSLIFNAIAIHQSHRRIISQEIKKGKGSIFRILRQIEEFTGRSFEEGH